MLTCRDTNAGPPTPKEERCSLGNRLVKQPAARVFDSPSTAIKYDPMLHGESYSTQSTITTQTVGSMEANLPERQADNDKRSVIGLKVVSIVEIGSLNLKRKLVLDFQPVEEPVLW